jgi:DNA-directed RNA polymerase subunit K/omega
MSHYNSRGTQLNNDFCVQQAGGNRFDLVIMASARSREIRSQHRDSQKFEHLHSNVSALLEFQNKSLDVSYMKKIKFNESRDHRGIDRSAKYLGR